MMDVSEIYNNRRYMIFNTSEVYKIDFDEVYETSENTLRYSLNELKTFVKWDGDIIPNSVNILESKEGPYNNNQMIEILSTGEWYDPTSLTINNIN
jgi:hypothetical protein